MISPRTGRVVVVTGTSTGVGKTIATAALAATSADSVVVCKPVQTGIADGEPTDAEVVHRLTGRAVHEFTGLEEPLAPDSAARLRDVRIPPVAEYADRIGALAGFHDTVIVEGAGGVLVRLDTDGGTILDLATDLRAVAAVSVVVVAAAGLGTLNHAELTVAAIRARGLEPAGLVIGSWPRQPGLAEQQNLVDLPRVTRTPLLGVIPADVGRLEPPEFQTQSRDWLTPGVLRDPA